MVRKRKVPSAIDKRLKALDKLLKADRPKGQLETNQIHRCMDDLKNCKNKGFAWDEDQVERTLHLFTLMKHWKGKFANQKLTLADWQEHCIIAPLFGWYLEKTRSKGGYRRFRTAGIEMPRKNGKTTLAAGIGLQGLTADGEHGAEVYSAATKKDQANIAFKDAKGLLGPELKQLCKVHRHAISFLPLAGTFQSLSSDSNSLDGLNIHRCIVDELHAHKTRDLWDVLLTATGARDHPLILWISTAGYNRQSIWYEQREYCCRILDPNDTLTNESYFVYMTGIDDGDDWLDPKIWWKANPNMNISLNEDYLVNEFTKAEDSPQYENKVRRLHLNQVTEQAVRAIVMRNWDRCNEAAPDTISDTETLRLFEERLKGQPCWGAIDLASTRDLCAWARVWRLDGKFYTRVRYYAPEEASNVRQAYDLQSYNTWAQKGLITLTPGSATDYDRILRDIENDHQFSPVLTIALDPHNSSQFAQSLLKLGWMEDDVVNFPQWARYYHEPWTRLVELVNSQHLQHGGDEVLRWMAANTVAKEDSNGYVKPDKQAGQDKIDGIVALTMALAMSLNQDDVFVPLGRFYEENDIEVF